MKRTTFSFATVPAFNGGNGQFATLTFTPPTSGTAVVTAQGWCNLAALAAGSTNEINIAIAPTLAGLFSNVVLGEWGVLRIPGGLPSGNLAFAFESQTTLEVTANTSSTVVLGGKHAMGATADNCSGSLMVEVFTGSLP
jgi:hypothetical protein